MVRLQDLILRVLEAVLANKSFDVAKLLKPMIQILF
jgi:hypothetical protein